MPSQSDIPIPRTGRAASALGQVIPFPLVKKVAATSLGMAVAVPGDAVSPWTAAGAPTAPIRGFLKVLQRYWRESRERRRARVTLYDLSERELRDIGMTSTELNHIVARRSSDRLRDGTAFPGMR